MKISVIIPCFNVEHYVRRAVQSVVAQTHADLEVIFVDDGSTDGTREILKELGRASPERITLIEQKNRGACAARNAGMAIANGNYLQFLDADDELLPEKLTHQARLAEKYAMPSVIVGSSRTLSPEGVLLRTVIQTLGDRDPWMDLMCQGMNVTSTILWSRSAVAAVNGWQEGLGSSQEYDLMFRMLQNGATVVYDDQVLTEIHKRIAGSITQTDLAMNQVRSIELRVRILQHVRDNGLAEDLRPYHQALFDGIRILYRFDRKLAMEYFTQWIPGDFVPGISNATGRGYLLLHRLLGFDLANRVRSWS